MMKKNAFGYWIFGGLLFGAGFWSAVHIEAVWPPLLLFLGAVVFFLPAGLPPKDWKGLFASPFYWRKPMDDEALFVARFLAVVSWTARREGILALESLTAAKAYDHPVFLRGISLIIDGMDPEYVKQVMEKGQNSLCFWYEAKRHAMRQAGAALLFVGKFGGLAGAFAYAFRVWNGQGIPSEGVYAAAVLAFLFLMAGMTAHLLIPGKILEAARSEKTLQRQIIDGLMEIQQGDSPHAILIRQAMFLSEAQRKALQEMPVPEELKPHMKGDSYEQSLYELRSEISHDNVI